jgi:hypothetical protein
MKCIDLHISFRVLFNQLNTNKNKNFLPEEIDLLLNDELKNAMVVILNAESNIRKEGYSDSQYRLDMIEDSIIHLSTADEGSLITLEAFNRGVKIALPSDYYTLFGSTSDSEGECYSYTGKTNRLYKTGKDLNWILNDYCSRTAPDSPVSELRGSVLYIYTDNFTISNVSIQYLPSLPIILNSDSSTVLPYSDDFWRIVVDNTVNKALAVSSKDYNRFVNETIKNE